MKHITEIILIYFIIIGTMLYYMISHDINQDRTIKSQQQQIEFLQELNQRLLTNGKEYYGTRK